MNPNPLRIAIVGGGPGGLTLACILRRLIDSTDRPSLAFTVFELDASRDSRSQGGMLDIHKGSGQEALERAGVKEGFRQHMRVDATEMYMRSKDGTVVLHHTEEGEEGAEEVEPERPEVDRRVLRSILLDALPDAAIEWGKKLVSISSSGSKFTLHFANGTSSEGFDIVVGADGAWSKVRSSAEVLRQPLSTPSRPPFSGVICIESLITDVANQYPHLSDYVGKGTCTTLGETNGVFSQLNGDGSLRTYFMLPDSDENWTLEAEDLAESNGRGPRTVSKVRLVEKLLPASEWCSEARDLLLNNDTDHLLVRPLYEYPPGHRWTSPIPGIVLLGDAAHVMTPFAGVGVNLALQDALDLSEAIGNIVQKSTPISDALKEYADTMFKRATENVSETIRNREMFFGKVGPDGKNEGNGGAANVARRFMDMMGGISDADSEGSR